MVHKALPAGAQVRNRQQYGLCNARRTVCSRWGGGTPGGPRAVSDPLFHVEHLPVEDQAIRPGLMSICGTGADSESWTAMENTMDRCGRARDLIPSCLPWIDLGCGRPCFTWNQTEEDGRISTHEPCHVDKGRPDPV